ncbi:MAG: hypothetical protein RRA94_10015 [Bacteroidota bacterium]|nr:hypothetical protein [Bacteroidota bacterium]
MSTGAYAFLYFGDTEQLLPAIDALKGLPQTQSWHAVDGHYHLAVALSDNGAREQLEALPGLQHLLYCPVETEVRGGFTVEAEPSYAWLTMEIDSEKAAAVEEALRALPETALPALAFGDDSAVAAIRGATFEVVDKMVESAIRPLDGVLRVKRDWIIDLTQL